MEKMTPTQVLRKFFEKDGVPPNLQEMTAFVRAVPKEERLEMAKAAAKQLGVELDLSAAA